MSWVYLSQSLAAWRKPIFVITWNHDRGIIARMMVNHKNQRKGTTYNHHFQVDGEHGLTTTPKVKCCQLKMFLVAKATIHWPTRFLSRIKTKSWASSPRTNNANILQFLDGLTTGFCCPWSAFSAATSAPPLFSLRITVNMMPSYKI